MRTLINNVKSAAVSSLGKKVNLNIASLETKSTIDVHGTGAQYSINGNSNMTVDDKAFGASIKNSSKCRFFSEWNDIQTASRNGINHS